MIDIVFPNKNEEQFIELAKKLGIKQLIFAYANQKEFYTKKTNFPTENLLLTTPQKMPKQTKNKYICKGNREALEQRAYVAYDFEQTERSDHTHYRQSGLNQVLCKLATEKNVRIGFSMSSILSVTGVKQAVLLGRIAQNIQFCKKYKTPTKIASFATKPEHMRSPEDLASLFTMLGMQKTEIKLALD
ncbi:hypothetical protein COV18_03570 [Candidatus Woesearchaeota archaeon CG10_big_fil_rev_8_21_14_0_10_37_12]|nr:MAG: hypothetical protein COV18_03570 [Candidatus Woesearchaeota archaeon CG10_big_fil_rev_8_21_14_0_10_37_12]